MSNEEAIKQIVNETCSNCMGSDSDSNYKCSDCGYKLAIQSLEENTKLKAEIEQLKQNIIDSANDTYSLQKLDHELLTKEIDRLKEENDFQNKIILKWIDLHDIESKEIEQLKAELEQSVKLLCEIETTIPCDDEIMSEWCDSNCDFNQTQPQCYKKYFELKVTTND